MPDDPIPPIDWGWFSSRQYEHLLNVLRRPGGMDRMIHYVDIIRHRVDICRDHQLTPGRTIRTVMPQTRGGFEGIEQADLIPVTRGILTAIYEELPE